MKTTRIELEGEAGSVAIERLAGSTTIRIDSIMRNAPADEVVWKTLEMPARIDNDELFKVAEVIQRRSDGVRGPNSDVHDYFRERVTC